MSAHAATHADHESHAHGSAKYFKIGIVLFILTALEVLLFEVCRGHLVESSGGVGVALGPWFGLLLLLLSALKFWLVAMFYMHLKDDMSFLSWVFASSLCLAAVVISALIALFVYNRTLWWTNGTPWK